MLVLTRRVGESLKIGNDVTVTILENRGNQVRVGIDAPTHIAVHREEIHKQIRDGMTEDAESANSPTTNG